MSNVAASAAAAAAVAAVVVALSRQHSLIRKINMLIYMRTQSRARTLSHRHTSTYMLRKTDRETGGHDDRETDSKLTTEERGEGQ